MLYVLYKMHQIPLRLGLCPRPRWESLQRSPDPKLYLGGLLLRGERGEEGYGRKIGDRGIREAFNRINIDL